MWNFKTAPFPGICSTKNDNLIEFDEGTVYGGPTCSVSFSATSLPVPSKFGMKQLSLKTKTIQNGETKTMIICPHPRNSLSNGGQITVTKKC